MTEPKEIPSGGTRLKYNVAFVKALAVICASLLVAVLLGDISSDKFEQVKWILIFGFTGSGGALGIYTASENGVKASYASLNRSDK